MHWKILSRKVIKGVKFLSLCEGVFISVRGAALTLDCRLRHFSINYIDYDTPLETVEDAIAQELEGPGSLLGVRAMTKKLRMHHDIKVPRNLVNAAMYDADPQGLED